MDNLIAILDFNGHQSGDAVADIMPLGNMAAKWEDFGWDVQVIDGHDIPSLVEVFSRAPRKPEVPTFVLCNTVKGMTSSIQVLGDTLVRLGTDATIVACGVMVGKALEAAGQLAKEGLSVQVLEIHTLKPIDRNEIVRVARETGAIVSAEENNVQGGLGGAVAEVLADETPTPMVLVGIRTAMQTPARTTSFWSDLV